MTVSLTLVIIMGALYAAGVYAMLERSLTRVLIGFLLLGNATNLLLLIVLGAPGVAPFFGEQEEMSDPLPQAMVLTAIVITLGMTAFLLAMAYRSWQLHRHDEVQDDVEDRRIARLAARDQRAFEDDDTEESTTTLDEEAAETRDETDEGEPSPAGAAGTHHRPTDDRGEGSR
jgi:multicomponent Na+:H+ antiporter subunit C